MKNTITSKLLWLLVSTTLFVSSCGDTSGNPPDEPGPVNPPVVEDVYYKIEWKNYDGTLLETDERVKEGTIPTYNGRTPIRESSEQYSYTFDGWTPQVVAAVADATYTATYKEKVRTYTITWKNYDGKVLSTELYDYGLTPSFKGTDPVKPKDDQYTYTFDGWDEEIVAVTSDKTYTAKFTQTLNEYTVTWKDEDGTVIDTEQYAYGETPSFKGTTPTKASDTYNTYTFDKWTPAVTEVKGNQTYTASYTSNKVKLSVSISYGLYNKNSMLLEKYDALPTTVGQLTTSQICDVDTKLNLAGSLNEGYVFLGWYQGTTLVSNDINYELSLSKADIALEARFRYVDYSLSIGSYNPSQGLVKITDGSSYTYAASDTKQTHVGERVTVEAHSLSTSKFLGWYDENNVLVSTDANYSFSITEEDTYLEAKWNYFTITYDLDGGTNNAGNVDHFDTETAVTLYNPTKDWYEFAGWECNGVAIENFDSEIAKNVTLKATWSVKEYHVTYVLDGGTNNPNNPDKYTFENDEWINLADPTKDGYVFAGWYLDKNFYERKWSIYIQDKADVTLYAKWVDSVTITLDANGGTLDVSEIEVGYGLYCYIPTPTAPDGKQFNGWRFDDNCVSDNVEWNYTTSDVTLVADYCDSGLLFSVTDYDNKKASVSGYNGDATSITVPEKYYEYEVTSIKENAFKDKSKLTSITLPSTITSIGYDAFTNCTNLTSMVIPTGVAFISYSTFKGCSNLESISIPNTVTSIGEEAFSGCSSLTSLVIPSSVTFIGRNILYGCNALASLTIPFIGYSDEYDPNKHYALCSLFDYYSDYYQNKDVIPESLKTIILDGSDTSLDEGAFYECSNLTSVVIKSPITEINSYAFYRCSKLGTVSLPNTITSIGLQAFINCSNLKTLNIPTGLTTIGGSAFAGCSSLESVELPNGVTSLGDRVFEYCSSLKSMVMPNTVTSIGEYAFYNCTSLTSLTLSNTLTTIKNNAFENCSGLTTIVIPDSVTKIGIGAFINCTSLESMTLPFVGGGTADSDYYYIDYLGYIFSPYDSGNIENNSQNVPSTLKEVAVSDCCTSINSLAFAWCSNIEKITLSANLTSIGEAAFANCTSLKNITIPNKVTSLGSSAFSGCSSIEEIVVPNTVTIIGDYAFNNCSGLTSITLPNGLLSIGNSAFAYCTSLESIDIPSTVTTIGDSAFSDCASLLSMVVPDSVTSIGQYAFYNCNSMTSITLPFVGCGENSNKNQLYYIFAEYDFKMPENLTQVILSSACTSIPNNAFSGCKHIESITVPSTVTSIGEYAFYGSGITSFTIPTGITEISDYTFGYCSDLTSITIPSNVTALGKYAFEYSGITAIVIPDSVTSIGENVFYKCDSLISLTLPFVGDTVDSDQTMSYFASSGLSSLKTIVVSDVCTSIGDYAFASCHATSITLGSGVETIGEYAFSSCRATSITLGSNVETIGYRAFNGCSGLTSIVIPNSVTSLGDSVFSWCTNLTSVTLSQNITSLTQSMFSNCTKLTSFTIPSNISSISKWAFDNSGLTSITIPNTVTSMEYGAFVRCNSLVSITISYVGLTAADSLKFGAIFDENPQANTSNSYVPSSLKNVTITNETRIPDDAFYSCEHLESITINSGVTSIGRNAFSCLFALTSISIPNTVETIGNNAFSFCSVLESIALPNSVVSIGDNAFIYCYDLEEVAFGNNLESIGESMFSYSGVKTVRFADDGALTSIPANVLIYSVVETVVLPNTLITIGNRAFYNCSTLTSVNIPNSVETIGENAFYCCSGLTNLTIGSGIVTIGNRAFYNAGLTSVTIAGNSLVTIDAEAFYGCGHLESINLPNGLETIGNRAFCGCSSLTSIVVPNSVTSFGYYPFSGCSSIESLTIPSISAGTYYQSGLYVFFGTNDMESIRTVTVTNITSIPDYAFTGYSHLQTVNVPNNVTSIGAHAFNGCSSLTNYNLSPSVSLLIGEYAFSGCLSLTSLSVFNNVTYIGDYAFSYCGFESVYWGNSIASVGSSIFGECSKLKTVTIGDAVTAIPAKTFSQCKLITSVTIPHSVESIGDDAFYDCPKLVEIINHSELNIVVGEYDNGRIALYAKQVITNSQDSKIEVSQDGFVIYNGGADKYLIDYIGNDSDIVIPNTITKFLNYALYNCSFSTVSIPNSITAPISYNMFAYCSNMTSITLSNTCTNIESNAFYGCTKLESITIPTPVVGIGDYAFDACNALSSVSISDNVEYIGMYAFAGSNITSIIIPDSVLTIHHYAFYRCTSLSNVYLGSGLTFIGRFAFGNCSALETIFIPISVDTIYEDAFFGDENLSIYCEADAKPQDWDVLWNRVSGSVIVALTYWGQTRPNN